MEKAFSGMQEGLYGGLSYLVPHTAISIIQRDLYFLEKKAGRPRMPASSEKPAMDPWLSYIIHFGLNRNPTGVAEFDEMYRDVKAFALSGNASDETKAEFDKVIKIYREKHPGVLVDLKP